MAVRCEEDHPSIVVVGGFDPRRFSPDWFRSQRLLGADEADQADIRLMASNFADWSTEWFDLQVTTDRLIVIAKVESRSEPLRDFVVGTLQLLEHTVTTAVGLNRSMHFDVGGESNWHRVGDTMAPKELWSKYLRVRPGMRVLQIEQTKRDDDLPGKVVVSVQPSLKYLNGVYFDVNNEIVSAGTPSVTYFLKVIQEHWQRLMGEARTMAEEILAQATQ